MKNMPSVMSVGTFRPTWARPMLIIPKPHTTGVNAHIPLPALYTVTATASRAASLSNTALVSVMVKITATWAPRPARKRPKVPKMNRSAMFSS